MAATSPPLRDDPHRRITYEVTADPIPRRDRLIARPKGLSGSAASARLILCTNFVTSFASHPGRDMVQGPVSKPPANSPRLDAPGAQLLAQAARLETASEGRCLHVSLGGMFIPASAETKNLPVGSLLTLELSGPAGLQGIRTLARVVRVDPHTTSNPQPGLHVEFLNPPAEAGPSLGEFPAPNPGSSRESRVLVVDDDTLMRENAASVMRSAGYEVLTARNGIEALALVLSECVDLVLTDVSMPSMDGWQLLRLIRSRPHLANLPVIFLTRLNSDAERHKGYELGVNDYIDKPYTPENLRSRISAHLEHESSAAPSARQVLRGDLAQVSLSSLLSLMEMERRTGQVRLQRGGEEALMYVRNGTIAQIDLPAHEQHREGLERIFYLLDWHDGEFVLSASNVDIPGDLNYSTSYTLLEYAKAVDEETRAAASQAKG